MEEKPTQSTMLKILNPRLPNTGPKTRQQIIEQHKETIKTMNEAKKSEPDKV